MKRGLSLLAALLLLGVLPGGQVGSATTTQLADIPSTRYAQIIEELWSYTPELPKHVLDMGIKIGGDRSRLDRAIAKMLSGQHVKVVALGGSVSLRGWNKMDESFLRQVHKWLELTFVPGCRDEAEKVLEEEKAEAEKLLEDKRAAAKASDSDSRRSRTLSEILPMPESTAEGRYIYRGPNATALHSVPMKRYRTTGHICSMSKIELIPLAVPAAGPGYAERCVLQHLPHDVDLVIIDFGANDYQLAERVSNPERHALERIFRTLLVLQNHPAILLFEQYSWMQARGSYTGGGKYGVSLAEDKHMLIAEYYGTIQGLSVRSVIWQILHASGDQANRVIYLGKDYKDDTTHLTGYGHRWYADIIINYLRDVSESLISKAVLANTLRGSSLKAEGIIRDRLPGGSKALWDETSWAGGKISTPTETVEGRVVPHCHVPGTMGVDYPVYCSSDGLKPPFFKDNEAEPAGVCAIGMDFVDVVESPHPGWEWVDEGRGEEHKWGFVSNTTGSALSMKVDVSRHVVAATGLGTEAGGSGGLRTRSRTISGFIVFLQSWTELGTAELSCSGGCICEAEKLDAIYEDSRVKATTPRVHSFSMQKNDTDEECKVQIKILEETRSGGHKFKVIGITTSTNPVWHLNEIVERGDDKYVPGR